MTDAEILAARAAVSAALSRTDVRSLREDVQDAYGRLMDACRSAGRTAHYLGSRVGTDPAVDRGPGEREDRYAQRIREAEENALDEEARWKAASVLYARARAAALPADVETLACRPTSTEAASEAAFRRERLECPPVGWGRSTPDYETRVARWRSRPEEERLRDPHRRDCGIAGGK